MTGWEGETEPEQVWLPASESLLEWSDDFHDLLLRDRLRMAAYRLAIAEATRPGMVVVDLGTGTGILAQWALEAGAARVYGIELNEAILKTAVERITAAGFADRFVPLHGLSTEVDLPEPADLVISEILGNLADNEGCLPILQDARARFLRADGAMLPQRVESYLVPVWAEQAHDQVRRGQHGGDGGVETLDAVLRRRGADSRFDLYYDVVLPVSGQLAAPRLARGYTFTAGEEDTYQVAIGFPIQRAGVFTGFKGYFAATLSDRVTLDISGDGVGAGLASESWKHCYLPVSAPVEVRPQDQVVVRFGRHTPTGAQNPFRQAYSWQGQVMRDGEVIARFSQRTGPVDDRG